MGQYLNEDTRTWLIDDDALDAIGNDVQTVVNCTQAGDSVFFNVSGTITPASPITIPWRLRLSAYVENANLVDGVFPQTQGKTIFRCPRENKGIFIIR